MTHDKMTSMTTTGMVLVTAFCGGALANALLDGAVAAQGGQAVTTTQVNLVDREGVLRGVLSADDERGNAGATFYDGGGQPRVVLGVSPDGAPFVGLRNQAGEDRLSARVVSDDALLIVGDDRRTHGVFASTSGVPVLSLADGQQGRAQMQLAESGAPSLIFAGADGQRRAAVTVDDRDTPVITLYENGRARVTIGIVEQAAVLNMTGTEGSRVVVGVAGNGLPSITMANDRGEVIGALP